MSQLAPVPRIRSRTACVPSTRGADDPRRQAERRAAAPAERGHPAVPGPHASRVPFAPVMPAARTTHTAADPGRVPSEVTTGEPDVNPNLVVLLATSVSRGRPPRLTPNFSTRR